MKYLQIILNLPLNQPFTYSYIPDQKEKEELVPQIGKRAEIMFGNRKTTGFIVDILDEVPPTCPVEKGKIRPIKRILDKEPLFQKELIELAKWISHYYLCTFGEAVFAMIPSGRRETSAGGFNFEEDLEPKPKNQLSDEQQNAVNNIFNSINEDSKQQNTSLFNYIYGPTGSGKTEVFLSLAEKVLEQGKGVIYLVPEISLTGQVAKSIVERFGNTAAILHSGLTPSQKLAQWHKILHKEAKVIVGARSAIFAPVPDLGLIIIDEEHDGSYKSGTTPRYHARQVAMHRASQLKIPLIMGSATPSLEVMARASKGVYKLLSLPNRVNGKALPLVKIIDMNEKIRNSQGHFSDDLVNSIREKLEKGEQVILFLNRRGYSSFVTCKNCGYTFKCPNCDISLTYHKSSNTLRCHYCGYGTKVYDICPECKEKSVNDLGVGTQKIEEELGQLFPSARVVRMDFDTTSRKGAHEEMIEAFKNFEYDILLGTQIVAKGLDFPNVTLVGVINADTSLNIPDFRSSETTFQLLNQVSGRSGRGDKKGSVIIQTYNPDHYAILYAKENNYKGFFMCEMKNRKLLNYPPYYYLVLIRIKGKDYNYVSLETKKIKEY